MIRKYLRSIFERVMVSKYLHFILMNKLALWVLAISVLIFLLYVVFYFVRGNYIPDIPPEISKYIPQDMFSLSIGKYVFTPYSVLYAGVVISVGMWCASVLLNIIKKRIYVTRSISSESRELIYKACQFAIYFFTGLMIADTLGIDINSLAVFGGALGIGIGFGLQKITGNFISGLIILIEKSVKPDDLISLDDGTFGFVRSTGARFCLIEGYKGEQYIIPNEYFISNRVTHLTYQHKFARVDITLGVEHGSDLRRVKGIMIEAAKQHPLCLNIGEYIPECYVREFGDFSIRMLLVFWIKDVTEGRYTPQSDVMITISEKFKENNIVIPYPKSNVYAHIQTQGEQLESKDKGKEYEYTV